MSKRKPESSEARCCCGDPDVTADSGAAQGAGRTAVGIDAGLKESNLKHLRRIEGQVRGIASMVESDRYCADIVTQISAVRESLHTVARNLMRNHLTHCAAKAMHGEASERDQMIDELLEMVGKIAR